MEMREQVLRTLAPVVVVVVVVPEGKLTQEAMAVVVET
jgi:hypothetical protein